MRLWHAGTEEINQFYNNIITVIKPNTIQDYPDDLAVFLLNKKEIKGLGLVQLKENDSKEARYKEARLSMFNWATEKYTDYERHSEEREGSGYKPMKPHAPIINYKKIIDDYNEWVEKGMLTDFSQEVNDDKKTVYACPHCSKEFDVKVAYFGHLRSHQKGEDVNISTAGNTSQGKG